MAPMPLPVSVIQRASSVLTPASPWQSDVFIARLRAHWPALRDGLRVVHPQRVEEIAGDLVEIAARRFLERPEELHDLDRRREADPHWLSSPRMIGYAAYTERFGGTLAGVAERTAYLDELGVTYLHLMPLLRTRAGDSDGGYAVVDYREVRDDLGTMIDLEALATTLRHRGISLVLDFVLNHVAEEHEWATKARAGIPKYRDYFHMFPDRSVPDAYERTLPEIFPDFAPGNFTWDEKAQAWVWTTFNAFQWDLNWSNPDVLAEFTDIMLFLANKGVEVLRLDAIAFMWKRMGTNCQNQPEVHALTSILHAIARMAAPGLAFKAEAIVGPHDLVQYLGLGEYEERLSDLAYHNTWMVQLWSMIAAQDTRLAVHTLRGLPPTPEGATWISYIRCHDDIGWAIDDGDAAAVGLSGPLHRAFLSDFYAGESFDSFSDGLVFQANPQTGDRRISGTMASLTGASESYNPHLTATGVARMKLLVAATYGTGGLPVIWSGDELALPNDPEWASDPTHADDNRWAHRPALPDTALAQRHDHVSVTGAIFEWHCSVGQVRARLPQLDGQIASEVLPVANPGVLAVGRRHAAGDMVQLYNVTDDEQAWPAQWLGSFTLGAVHDAAKVDSAGERTKPAVGLVDALTARPVHSDADGDIHLPPWGVLWLVAGD